MSVAETTAVAGRVVVTGIGVISSIGVGREEFTRGMREGRSGVSPITAFDTTGFAHANACEVVGFEPGAWISRTPVDRLSRAAQFSVAAARMAFEDAGLDDADQRGKRYHISIGTTDGASRELDQLTELELHGGPESMDPVLARTIPSGQLATAIADELELADVEATTLTTACSAGNYAIGNGLDALRLGEADFALCGGADAVCRKTFTAFYRLGTIAPDCCRPFDKDRQGILTGEGGGVLLLETLESALARGARIYAEVLGYGLNCDAHHPVAPDQDSISRCITLALDDAGVKPEQVDLISAHGTGTKANDVTEARAINAVYEGRPPRTVSLKAMLGHTMGAASALAGAACAIAITESFIPPTINHRETDPDCEIDCVPNHSVPAELRIVQSNGMAFGGNNSVVIFGAYEGETR
ncbi:beta-ketoacyl-[acyl-carrier-protein] synthase family protein [Kitasatospora sp. NPDC048239]|uniref:beta-ketoacyl-[acyl-carrier-protein] synthase family protein n=1 Tax=Kitasatospora sp. NPDC048239 TaxID=3364046 RepID=UPI0037102B0D